MKNDAEERDAQSPWIPHSNHLWRVVFTRIILDFLCLRLHAIINRKKSIKVIITDVNLLVVCLFDGRKIEATRKILLRMSETPSDWAITVTWRGRERSTVTSEPVTFMNFPSPTIFGAAAEGDANLLEGGRCLGAFERRRSRWGLVPDDNRMHWNDAPCFASAARMPRTPGRILKSFPTTCFFFVVSWSVQQLPPFLYAALLHMKFNVASVQEFLVRFTRWMTEIDLDVILITASWSLKLPATLT